MGATISKIISTSIEKGHRIIKYLRFGKKDIQTSHQIGPFGDDSNPPKGMRAVQMPTADNGKKVVVGYFNKNFLAAVGEKRIFSVDENGDVAAYIHLKADGSAEVLGTGDFLTRFNELESGFNELRDDMNEFMAEYKAHTHPGVTPGPGITGPYVSALLPSVADISAAKIDQIETIAFGI